jgi:hypothetical protein
MADFDEMLNRIFGCNTEVTGLTKLHNEELHK